jgi:hypothetical protein
MHNLHLQSSPTLSSLAYWHSADVLFIALSNVHSWFHISSILKLNPQLSQPWHVGNPAMPRLQYCTPQQLCVLPCSEFGPIFSWKIGGQKVVAVLDYDVIKSLLKVGDSKVGGSRGAGGEHQNLGGGGAGLSSRPWPGLSGKSKPRLPLT